MIQDTLAVKVAAGASVGISALVTATIGVDPQALFWALVGATLGLSVAGTAARLRAIVVYLCVALSSALLGTWLARLHFEADATARNALAALLAIGFHPLANAALTALPSLVAGWAKRLGGSP